MDDLTARRFLHDNVYSPIFKEALYRMTGHLLETPQEEAQAQAVALRLKAANNVMEQQRQKTAGYRGNMKQAVLSRVDRMAGNVLGDDLRRDLAVAGNSELAPYLSALDL